MLNLSTIRCRAFPCANFDLRSENFACCCFDVRVDHVGLVLDRGSDVELIFNKVPCLALPCLMPFNTCPDFSHLDVCQHQGHLHLTLR